MKLYCLPYRLYWWFDSTLDVNNFDVGLTGCDLHHISKRMYFAACFDFSKYITRLFSL